MDDSLETAMFGAGCFWGVQYYFDQVPGVIESSVGYSGGSVMNPTYEQICTGTTGHAEVVQLKYDADLVSYETLLKHFFRLHNPTELNRQGPDIGEQYRSVIFYYTLTQRDTAHAMLRKMQKQFDGKVVTQIIEAGSFFPAEDYHQKYSERMGRGVHHIPYEPV